MGKGIFKQFNLGMDYAKEDKRVIFVRNVTAAVLLFNVARQIFIASQTQVLENILLSVFWFVLAIGIFLKRPWAKIIVVNFYRMLFLIGLFSLILTLIGKDVNYFFSLFFYAENLKVTSAVLLKGVLLFLVESFCMVLMLDDKESIAKGLIAGILLQIIIPILFFFYLSSIYSGYYVDLYTKYVRFDQAESIINDSSTDYFFSEQFEYKFESQSKWSFMLREDMLDKFGITLERSVEVVLLRILNDKISTVNVKAFKNYNPADAYAELEGFRFAMLASEHEIIKDEKLPSDRYEIYNIITFSDSKRNGKGIFRVISNRLVIDFFLSSNDREALLKNSDEISEIINTIKIY